MMSYDTWGARRNPDGSPADPGSFSPTIGHREFTGHEAIPNVGLVNMNGRIYDPVIGRFLSADPTVQSVGNLQSYNRYSYVQNNPLTYTDPTGYWISPTFDKAVTIGIGIAAAIVCENPACYLAFSAAATAYNASSMLHGGASFTQVAISSIFTFTTSYFGGQITQAVGDPVLGGTLSGALFGALMTPATGGSLGHNFLHGAAAGFVGSFAFGMAAAALSPVSQASVAVATGGGQGVNVASLDISSPRDAQAILASFTNGDTAEPTAADIAACAADQACRAAVKNIFNVDLSTPPDKANLWTGGPFAKAAATADAQNRGAFTIELKLQSTPEGRAVLDQIEGMDGPEQGVAWKIASYRFVSGVSGRVNVFVGLYASFNSVFFTTELPVLVVKRVFGDVTAIDRHPAWGWPTAD
jgi:RHS repeat-associated protein